MTDLHRYIENLRSERQVVNFQPPSIPHLCEITWIEIITEEPLTHPQSQPGSQGGCRPGGKQGEEGGRNQQRLEEGRRKGSGSAYTYLVFSSYPPFLPLPSLFTRLLISSNRGRVKRRVQEEVQKYSNSSNSDITITST